MGLLRCFCSRCVLSVGSTVWFRCCAIFLGWSSSSNPGSLALLIFSIAHPLVIVFFVARSTVCGFSIFWEPYGEGLQQRILCGINRASAVLPAN